MALIICPECGKEDVSSSAVACPNCGFNIEEWLIECEEERLREEEELRLAEIRQKEAEEYENRIEEIPEPTVYGNKYAYLIMVIGAVTLGIIGGIWFVVAIVILALAYYIIAYVDYRRYLRDPRKWKEQHLKSQFSNSFETDAYDEENEYKIVCPNCGSFNVENQVFQENLGSRTTSRTSSTYKEKGHGCLWWLLIGWWWWMVDLFLWIFAFFPRLILRLFAAPYKKKKYVGKSRGTSKTVNRIDYKTVHLCQNCGYTW